MDLILEDSDIFDLSTDKSIQLSKMKCKDYYLLFQEKAEVKPAAVKSWAKQYPDIEPEWKKIV